MPNNESLKKGAKRVVGRDQIEALIRDLSGRGYTVIGPTIRDGAIVYDEVSRTADFPVGWTDDQEAGTYRLRRREDAALFGYVVGPHSWKKFLHPSQLRLWQAKRENDQINVVEEAMVLSNSLSSVPAAVNFMPSQFRTRSSSANATRTARTERGAIRHLSLRSIAAKQEAPVFVSP